MKEISLRELGEVLGVPNRADRPVRSICTDSRKLTPDALFFAIPGERFDGHDFVEEALKKGAAGAVVEKSMPEDERILPVKDVKQALLDLSADYRRRFCPFTVGVTGSVGKTSTKEMVAAILQSAGKTCKTQGNFNNEIGLPLTVFSMEDSDRYAVFEMGMSDFGEIAALTRVCRPDVAVITNIGVSHIERLGSQENILKAKLEILEGMDPAAPLIVNGEDAFLSGVSVGEHPVWRYGFTPQNDIWADELVQQEDGSTVFSIHWRGETLQAKIPAIGRHNVANALAGFCVGILAGLSKEQILLGMQNYQNAGLRQRVTVEHGVTVIADCYNASPDSMRSALEVVTSVSCMGKRYCVFGDMLELGGISKKAHWEVGRMTAKAGVDGLFCYGTEAEEIREGARTEGMTAVSSFKEKKELAQQLAKVLRPGDAVIFKASRGMQLEDVIDMWKEEKKNG